MPAHVAVRLVWFEYHFLNMIQFNPAEYDVTDCECDVCT